jgi:hypothetical protein
MKTKSNRRSAIKTVEKKVALGTVYLRTASRRAVEIKHLDKPPKFVKSKDIHPRRLLPLVREGMEREFHSQTPEAFMRPLAMAAPVAAGDEIVLVTNTELAAAGQKLTASSVGEPSTAINGNVVVYTGNWYAAVSADGGKTFQFIDPAAAFPDPSPISHFCCDQVVHYISKIDTFVWLLQYGPSAGDNIQRLAFSKTADVALGKWRLFDITTAMLKVGGAFLDFPDLAVGANNLYMTTNIFGPGSQVGSAVIRIPFASIETGKVKATPFVSTDFQSFRVAQNCGTTAFFAAHENTSTLKVFSWKEGQNAPIPKSVGVARWIGGNGYISRTPDGRRWLDRADPRITGATMANNELWFAWSVDRNSNHRPNPFVQIARIDATNLTLVDNVNLFDSTNATCYGALATNSNGEVGVSYMTGGTTLAPSHVVGILGIGPRARKEIIVAKGDRGPDDPDTGKGEWGDYLTCRRVYPMETLFAASGFTMKGLGDGTNTDATPRFVVFGRAADAGVIGPVGGGAPAGGPGPGLIVVGDGGGVALGGVGAGTVASFKDVNTLPVVSDVVAAKIKAAAMAEGNLIAPAAAEMVLPQMLTESPLLATKPGVERWPVKTGTDKDVALVGTNIIAGENLGAGIVEATIEELARMGRPPGMRPASSNFDQQFHDRRLGVVEQTVWSIEADVIGIKLEGDGDYHLVLQGASNEMMVAECPTPTKIFVGASPWLKNMQVARKSIDDKLVNKLSPHDFVQMDGKLVPRESLPPAMRPMAMPASTLVVTFAALGAGSEIGLPAFKTKVPPTPARITGVGFFDKVHGQTGAAPLNGIELHAILKIEWL